MADLYETLGVKRSATAAQVKKAFRRLAAKLHPDANPGDDSVVPKYHAVVAAYEVLSDPARRAEYDRTGQVPRQAQSDDVVLLNVIAPALLQVLQSLQDGLSVRSPKTVDVVREIRDLITRQRQGHEREQAELQKAHRVLSAACGRFSRDGQARTLMDDVVSAKLGEIARCLDAVGSVLDQHTRALDYLKTAKYRTDGSAAAGGDGETDFAKMLYGAWKSFSASGAS